MIVNVDFPEEVHRKFKSKCAIEGKPMNETLVELAEDVRIVLVKINL